MYALYIYKYISLYAPPRKLIIAVVHRLLAYPEKGPGYAYGLDTKSVQRFDCI